MRASKRTGLGIALAGIVALVALALGAQDQLLLREKEAPANGVWVDNLDLTGVPLRAARGRGAGGRAGQPATPPPPPVYALGGITYPHAVGRKPRR